MKIRREIIVRMYADVPIEGVNIDNGYDKSFTLKVRANGAEKEIQLGPGKWLFISDFFDKDSEYDRVIIEIWPREDDICK